jgi:hypothetical protein
MLLITWAGRNGAHGTMHRHVMMGSVPPLCCGTGLLVSVQHQRNRQEHDKDGHPDSPIE